MYTFYIGRIFSSILISLNDLRLIRRVQTSIRIRFVVRLGRRFAVRRRHIIIRCIHVVPALRHFVARAIARCRCIRISGIKRHVIVAAFRHCGIIGGIRALLLGLISASRKGENERQCHHERQKLGQVLLHLVNYPFLKYSAFLVIRSRLIYTLHRKYVAVQTLSIYNLQHDAQKVNRIFFL